jgi:hypothetical protein
MRDEDPSIAGNTIVEQGKLLPAEDARAPHDAAQMKPSFLTFSPEAEKPTIMQKLKNRGVYGLFMLEFGAHGDSALLDRPSSHNAAHTQAESENQRTGGNRQDCLRRFLECQRFLRRQ